MDGASSGSDGCCSDPGESQTDSGSSQKRSVFEEEPTGLPDRLG